MMIHELHYFAVKYFDLHMREKYFQFVETYVFADWKFLTFLGILLLIDTFLSIVKNWDTKKSVRKITILLFHKLIIYTCFLVLVHIIAHYTIEGKPNEFFGWFDNVAYSALIIRQSIFVLENMAAIQPNLIPAWILKRLKQYDKDGAFEPNPPTNASK
jgi:phage-related holin